MPFKTNPHQECPYALPSPPKPDQVSKTLNRRDLWNALEFFRIEALLRAVSMWDLYRRAFQKASKRKADVVPQPKNVQQWIAWYGQNKVRLRGKACADVRALLWDKTSCDRFAVVDGWAILLGSHHRLLRFGLQLDISVIPDPNDIKRPSVWISEGIVDLCASARTHHWIVPLEELQKEQKRFLYLRIDASVAPTANVKQLRTFLKKHHKAATVPVEKLTIHPITGEQTTPFHPRKDPPITNVPAWLKYFQCYDLRTSGLQPEEVAGRVYPQDIGAVEKVAQAVKRVKKVIEAAESNDWPPRNIR